jgi:hypothetical protein
VDQVNVQFKLDRRLHTELKKWCKANGMGLVETMVKLATAFLERQGVTVESEEPVVQEPDRR